MVTPSRSALSAGFTFAVSRSHSWRRTRSSGIVGRLRFPARTEFLCFRVVALGCESANRVQTQFRCHQQRAPLKVSYCRGVTIIQFSPKAMAYSGSRARSSGIVGRLRFPARTEFLCLRVVALGCESANRVQTQFRCPLKLWLTPGVEPGRVVLWVAYASRLGLNFSVF